MNNDRWYHNPFCWLVWFGPVVIAAASIMGPVVYVTALFGVLAALFVLLYLAEPK